MTSYILFRGGKHLIRPHAKRLQCASIMHNIPTDIVACRCSPGNTYQPDTPVFLIGLQHSCKSLVHI